MSSRVRSVVVVCAIAIVLAASNSRQDLRAQVSAVSSQAVYLTPQDTTLNLDASNYSAEAQLSTYTWPDYRVANAIAMLFDLSSIPAGARVEQATLRLALVESDATGDASYAVSAHKLLQNQLVPSRATGYTADGVAAWTANTCCYNNVPLAQQDISPAYDSQIIDKTPGFKSWSLTTMVREWIADPSANLGLLLNSDAGVQKDRFRSFASAEYADAALRPTLEVIYTLETPAFPPVVTITGPASGDRISGTIQVTATASDDGAVAAVQFQVDGTSLGDDTSAPYTAAFDTTSLSDGSHTLSAVARDDAGNTASSSVAVSVSNGILRIAPQDTMLNLNTTNYSRSEKLKTYTWPDYRPANAIVMNFDLSSVPAGAEILEATLHLAQVESDGSALPYTVSAHRIVGQRPVIERANGRTTDGVTPWTPSSCCHKNIPLAQADISAPYFSRALDRANGYKTWTLTSMVQDWLASQEDAWLLLNSDTTTTRDRYRGFASAEHRTTAGRPFLLIRYSVDTAPPTVSLLSPPADAVVSGPVRIEATAADDVRVAGVRFELNGSPLGPEIAEAPYVMQWDPAATPNGSYTLSAVARDAAGAVASASAPITVARDSVPPSVSLAAPAAGAALAGVVTVSATATDNVGVVGVQFKLDGANLGAEDGATPYAMSWDTTGVPNGPHMLTAVARDAAGYSVSSQTVAVVVANGSVYTASLNPEDTFLDINSTSYATSTVLGTYTWPDKQVANAILMKFDLASLPPDAVVQQAELQLALVEGDSAPEATYSISAHKVVGRNPVIAAATGYNADGVAGWTPNSCCHNGVPMAQADISSAYDTRAVDKTIGVKTWILTSMVTEWLASPASNFGVLLNADATTTRDRFRLFASMEHPEAALRPTLRVTYTSLTGPIATPPVVSISSPAAGASVAGTVTVSATATASAGLAGVQFRLDGNNLGPEDTTSPYSVSWNTSAVPDGSHTLAAIARDAAGNQTLSAAVTVMVSNPVPPGGGIAALYPGDLGIETHPDVLFTEMFEQSSIADLTSRYTAVKNASAMSFATSIPSGSAGGRSLQLTTDGVSVTAAGLYKTLPNDQRWYVRYYVNYNSAVQYSHTSVWLGGYNPPLSYPDPQAGSKPSGGDRFSTGVETYAFDNDRWSPYTYWKDMRLANDGNYWGNVFLGADETMRMARNRWYCVETMVSLNSPVTDSNGELAVWVDGQKILHLGKGFPNGTWSGGAWRQDDAGTPFGGFQWRSDSALALNWLWLQTYVTSGASSAQFDHLVVARNYIGCLTSGSPSQDTTPPELSLSAPAPGVTVSGSTVAAANARDDVGVAGVQFQIDGADIGAEDTTAPYSVAWDTTKTANGPHTLTAVARDAAGNRSTSPAVPVTVSNGTPGGAWPNEPTGLTLLTDWSMDQVLPTSGDGLIPGSPGWRVVYNALPGSSRGWTERILDAGAPFSASNVYDFVYPAGMVEGNAPATVYYNLSAAEVYAAFWWKPSAPFDYGPNGNKIAFIFNGGGDGGGQQFMILKGDGRLHVLPEYPGDYRWRSPNVNSTVVTLGQWHRIEWYATTGGTLKWWLDGVLQGSYSDVRNTYNFDMFQFSPTWGGNSGARKRQTDHYWFDHVRLSAR